MESVNQGQIQRDFNAAKSALHGQQGCLKNVDVINFKRLCPADGKCLGMQANGLREGFPTLWGEFLGIRQPLEGREVIRKDHGASNHRSCKAAAPGFIEAHSDDRG